jgi:transforming growth factor-beta-induced protein
LLHNSSFFHLAQDKDIVQTAIDKGNFKKLVDALIAADLVNTLNGTGPFTVFAPNDAAFSKLPDTVVTELLKVENKETLSSILKYHVNNGNLTSVSIMAMTLPANLTMLTNGLVTVRMDGNNIMVNDVPVVAADFLAKNGIIHALDSVLLPPLNIVETAILNGKFTTLVKALQAADLVGTLKGPGPFTVFAPTDAAFNKLPAGTVEDLLKPANKEKLSNILKYHVIGKRVTSSALPEKEEMLAGGTVTVNKEGNITKINDATVTTADVSNTNGVIHIIDTVLMPASSSTSFYVNQGFFTIFMSRILLSYHFSG